MEGNIAPLHPEGNPAHAQSPESSGESNEIYLPCQLFVAAMAVQWKFAGAKISWI